MRLMPRLLSERLSLKGARSSNGPHLLPRLSRGPLSAGLIAMFAYVAVQGAVSAGPADGAQRPILQIDSGGHRALIKDVAVSKDGRFLLSASDDKVVRIWDWRAGKTLAMIRGQSGPGHEGKIFAMALSPDNRWLAVGGWLHKDNYALRHAVRLYHIAPCLQGRSQRPPSSCARLAALLKGHDNVVFSLAFSADSRFLISGSADTTAIVWRLEGLDKAGALARAQALTPWRRLRGHRRVIYAVGLARPEQARRGAGAPLIAVTGSLDNTLALWNVSSGKRVKTLRGHQDKVRALAISPDQKFLVSGSLDHTIRLWDLRRDTEHSRGRLIKQLADQGTQVGALSFSPDGRFVLSGVGDGPDNHCHFYAVPSGRKLTTYRGHDNIVLATALFSDPETGRLLAVTAGGSGQEIHIWEAKTGRLRQKLKGTGSAIWAVGISNDGRHIAWGKTWQQSSPVVRGPLEFSLRLPDALRALGRVGVKLTGQQSRQFRRASTRFGRYRLHHRRGNQWGAAQHLDILKGNKRIATITRNAYNGYRHRAYTFTPDGRFIITAGSNGVLQIYDRSGRHIGDFVGHEGDVWAVSVSADGRFLVSGSDDQTVRLWNIKTRELLLTLYHGDRQEARSGEPATGTQKSQWALWTPQGYFTASPGGDRLIGWQINRGPDRAADFVTAAQLKKHFYRPDIINETIRLASAKAAIRRARGTRFDLADLLRRKPPQFSILSPRLDSRTRANPVTVKLQIAANDDPVTGYDVMVNGRQVTGRDVRGLANFTKAAHSRDLTVPLSAGRNRITITARNAVGQFSRELIVYHNGPSSIKTGPGAGVLYLLAVGVDRYPKLGRNLSFAGKDATTFVATMRRHAGPLYARVEARLLVNGGSDGEPTADNIQDALDFLSKAGPSDTVIVFLAGHGVNQGADYLFLPSDATKYSSGRWRRSTVLRWSNLQEALQAAQGRRILLVDTCHSGNAFNPRLIKDAHDAKIVVFSATDADTLAQETPRLGHGVFTYSLVAGLKGGADFNRDGKVQMLELGSYISGQVVKLTRGSQRPAFFLSGATDFVFARR